MKDLLVALIQSVFKYVVNPTVWSRVASDINSSPSRATPEPIQRIQSITDSETRDVIVSKALDLASQCNQQVQYLLDHHKMSQIQPSSGVEMLAVKEASSEKSTSDNTLSTGSELSNSTQEYVEGTQQTTDSSQQTSFSIRSFVDTPSSEGSGDTESYEEFADDEIINSQNVSVVSIGSTTQPSEISTEYSAKITTDSVNLADKSSSTSMSIDSTKSTHDSVEILSISSDATAP